MKKCKIHKPASNYFKSTVTTTTLFIHITHNISWMSTLTPQEVVLNQRDILRIVRCLKVVVKVVDASSNETDGKATIVEKIAAHTTKISELQQKIRDVEHKALVHQMEARIAQIRLQQMELNQLIDYANKLMNIRRREQELLTLTNALHSRIHFLKERIKTVEDENGDI